MKRLFKLVVVLVMLGGWPLALSAIHVVRTPGQLPVVGSMLPDWGTVHVFTKDQLGFRQTFADTRAWTLEDVAARPVLVNRMIELNMNDAMASAGTADDIDAARHGVVKPAAPAAPVKLFPAADPFTKTSKPAPAAPATQPGDHKTIFEF